MSTVRIPQEERRKLNCSSDYSIHQGKYNVSIVHIIVIIYLSCFSFLTIYLNGSVFGYIFLKIQVNGSVITQQTDL